MNSSHCSTKCANLSPTGMSGRGSTGSGKGWLSELCGGRVISPLGKILFITCRSGLSLYESILSLLRPIRLRRFRSRLFGRIFWHFKSSWRTQRLLLVKFSLRS